MLLPFMSQATRMESDPLSQYRWTHRLLVIDVPDTESGRSTMAALLAAIEQDVPALRDRDLLIVPVGDLPRAGQVLRPTVDLEPSQRAVVRRRLGLQGPESQLVLIGKDGGVKARQSGAFDLPGALALIDTMPMRRAERKPQ